MLMSAELPLPKRVFGHGFFLDKGVKMGKSSGNAIEPNALLDRYGADAMRYYFLKEIKFGQDGSFEESHFVDIVNDALADKLGNLLNRSLPLAIKNGNGAVPNVSAADIPEDNPLKALGQDLGSPMSLSSFMRSVMRSWNCYDLVTFILTIRPLGHSINRGKLIPRSLRKPSK